MFAMCMSICLLVYFCAYACTYVIVHMTCVRDCDTSEVEAYSKIDKCAVDLEKRVFLVVAIFIGAVEFCSEGAGDSCIQFSNG